MSYRIETSRQCSVANFNNHSLHFTNVHIFNNSFHIELATLPHTFYIWRRSSSSSNFDIIHKLRKSTTINHSFSVYRFMVRESERLCYIIALWKEICMTLYPNPRYAPTSCHQYKKASNIIDGDEYCHFFCQYLFFWRTIQFFWHLDPQSGNITYRVFQLSL